jgi:DNA-binding response OmpR family regulator
MTVIQHQGRILVVEDDADLALLVAARLKAAGYEVHTEYSGACALGYAAEHQPNLVVLDVRLPDLGGYEVCEELRKLTHCGDVPVVMFSVMDETIDRERGFEHGADAYLPKSCAPSQLLNTIDQLLSPPEPVLA